MKTILARIPDHVKLMFARLGIVLLVLYISRLIFFAFNTSAFQNLSFLDFFTAIWFDMITISLLFIPYYVLYLLPIPVRHQKWHRAFFKLYFHVTTALLLGLNLMDVEYFRYTSKRSTFDLFTMLSTGNDLGQLWMTFIKDFWLVIIMFILLISLTEYLYRKSDRILFKAKSNWKFYRINSLSFVAVVGLLLIIGRGGFALKPTGIIEASRYTKPENLAFILPTPFTMIKTIDQTGLEPANYMSKEDALVLFNPIKSTNPQNILPDGTNVVVIMLESFGSEFIGEYNDGVG